MYYILTTTMFSRLYTELIKETGSLEVPFSFWDLLDESSLSMFQDLYVRIWFPLSRRLQRVRREGGLDVSRY